MTSSSYNNGVGETRAYNDDDTLASIHVSHSGLQSTTSSLTRSMSDYGFSAGYDAEDRLTSWDRADTNLDQSWDLSPVGDWNSITENSSVQNRTHGPVHEILTAASQTVEHDPKGNMTLIPPVLRPGSDPLKLKWDFDNKLASADTDDSGTDDVFYRWDALGRRVGRDDGTNHTIYFQDGQQTLADYPAGTAAASPTYTYVYGSYIDEVVLRSGGSGVRYYHRNAQYSITALTDGGGSIVERYAYSAYGQVTFADANGTVQSASASNNRYTYTGRERDEGLALYHYRARMYDAVAGRFVSRDPIGFSGGSRNIYEFTSSHPASLVDPLGLRGWTAGRPGPPGMGTKPRTPARPIGRGCLCAKEKFEEWLKNEEANGSDWLDELPKCPCNIKKPKFYIRDPSGRPTGVPAGDPSSWPIGLPDGWEWDLALSWPLFVWIGTGVWNFHPGADNCLRSRPTQSGSVQQCCYDAEGFLITSGTGVGTPDRGSGADHEALDVKPFIWAMCLDRGFSGPHIDKYLKQRPPNVDHCDKNPTPR